MQAEATLASSAAKAAALGGMFALAKAPLDTLLEKVAAGGLTLPSDH